MKRVRSTADGIVLLGVGVLMVNMRGTYGDSWSLPSKIIFPQKTKFRFPKFRYTFKHLPLMWSEHTDLLIAAIHAKSQDTTKARAANEPPLILVLFWYMEIFRSATASANATKKVELKYLSPIPPGDIHELF